jgi:hypothetical protein
MSPLSDKEKAAVKNHFDSKHWPELTPEQKAVIAESFRDVDVFGPESDDAA